MLRSEAVARIQRGLGFRTDQEQNIIDSLQEAQRDLEGGQTLPWFLIQEDAAFAVLASTSTYTFPTDFLRVVEDEGLHYTSDDGEAIFLTKRTYEENVKFFADVDPGPPQGYTIRKGTIQIWPVPDIAYSLTWSYYKRATLLSTDVTNAWLTEVPELLIGLAGLLIAADLENEASTKKFGAMYQKWSAWLVTQMADREDQGMPRAMGRNH